jgi:hypothetical protein
VIKISDKIWYVLKPEHNDELAYMCPYDTNKEGEALSNVVKMQSTGRSWASSRIVEYKKDDKGQIERDENNQYITTRDEYVKGTEAIADNTPTTDFYVGSSVSRWSTSNKLFRVKDPRGFTVEIPTDNLATLLHHTTVVKGVVQEQCVWGREGNNHILLPVNSEPYLITLDQMDTLQNKLISVKDLKVGDWVKMFEDKSEYYYAGKLKGTWSIRGYSHHYSYSYNSTNSSTYSEWVDVRDEKWTEVFLRKTTYSGRVAYYVETFSKPKIVEVLHNEPLSLNAEDYSWYCPQRVTNKTNFHDRWQHTESKLVKVETK